ncbi:MAG TPA: hypothetical protein VMV50_03440 [Candidatus Paceibacterota bacterium]|nr:hypothetical protein [Candidatus Paceibacterota bacterium]
MNEGSANLDKKGGQPPLNPVLSPEMAEKLRANRSAAESETSDEAAGRIIDRMMVEIDKQAAGPDEVSAIAAQRVKAPQYGFPKNVGMERAMKQLETEAADQPPVPGNSGMSHEVPPPPAAAPAPEEDAHAFGQRLEQEIGDFRDRRDDGIPTLTDVVTAESENGVPEEDDGIPTLTDVVTPGSGAAEARGAATLHGEYADPSLSPDDVRNMREELDRMAGAGPAVVPGEPQTAAESAAVEERTPAEERRRLHELVGKLTGGAKEKLDWWKSSEERLINRSAELDAQLAEMGKVEKGFRWLGERYNKLGWKTKLAVGVALGIGYGGALAAGASLPILLACIGAIGAQRTAALSTQYLKYEKEFTARGSSWARGRALLNAVGYSALLTGGSMLVAKGVEDVLGHYLGHEGHAPGGPPTGGRIEGAPAAPPAHTLEPAALAHPAHETVAPMHEAATAAAKPAASSFEVAASGGHGTEFMMKQMWESMRPEHLDPKEYASLKGTDFYRLLTATPKNIDSVVRDIANSPNHAFYDPAHHASILVGPHDTISFDAHGNMLLHTDHGTFAHAPLGAHMTPDAHPEAPLAHETLPPTEHAATVDVTHGAAPQHAVPAEGQPFPPVEHAQNVVHSGDGSVVHDGSGNPVHSGGHEAAIGPPPPVPAEHAQAFVNRFGVSIDPTQAHVFQDSNGAVLSYGNDYAARLAAAEEFVRAHHDATVWMQAEKPVFHGGAWHPWVFAVKYAGFFRGVQPVLPPDGMPTPDHIGYIDPTAFSKELN